MKRIWVVFIFLFLLSVFKTGNLFCRAENQTLQDESGFFQIDPVHYYFHYHSYFTRLALTTSQARIWYTFLKADQDGENKPLFIFFNGGPGSGTTNGLMSHNTGRMTQDTLSETFQDEFIPNPFRWTRMGNLLYVDARETGFSYNLMDQPQDYGRRFFEFGAQNYNSYIDGADFIRLLLDFLARHPVIQKKPVIIVGESYGGIRTTVMLHILLNYRDYADGTSIFQDPSLVEKIQAHYNAVFPEYRGQVVPPEVITTQFGHQVLIQPAISAEYQHYIAGQLFEEEGSVIYQIAEEEGVIYIPCSRQTNEGNCDPRSNVLQFILNVAKRDPYIYSKPADWMPGYFANAARLLQNTENLMNITGTNVTNIDHLYASSRANAYRLFDLSGENSSSLDELPVVEQYRIRSLFRVKAKLERTNADIEDLPRVFGVLQPWDRYFLDLNHDVNWAFYVNIALHRGYDIYPLGTPIGELFLENVVHVKTFITNAKYDLVVFSEAIPGALALHTDILESSVHDRAEPANKERPGQIILTYRSDAFSDIETIGTRIIRFPWYDSSCHCVPLTQPEELFLDVSSWLFENSVLSER